MLSALTSPPFQPFTIAALAMIGIFLLEVVSLLFGNSLSGMIDGLTSHGTPGTHVPGVHVGTHAPGGVHTTPDGPLATALDWVNPGRVPLLVILVIALAAFAIIGLALQLVLAGFVHPLPAGIASAVVFPCVLPATRWSTRLVARIVPRDETYALNDEDFVGMTGVVTVGPARHGVVARARIVDTRGNAHFPRIEPFERDEVYSEGTPIMVVEVRSRILAVSKADPRLQKSTD